MALIVQKFGGSSVKDRNRIFNVARIVANTHKAGNDVVVVVSAQGDTTDDLIAKAGEITHNPSAREMDMLLATGEQISISLLAMALNELGCHAISLTGWQAGFRTDRAYTKARISRLETERISSELERNRVVVVAGFQGLNKLDDITTLGRGGSDTSAVAIAAALHADRCQIFTDVEGVYTADPRKVRNTRKLEEITFDEMLELASLGAQVLNNRSVELAKKYNVELEVLSSLNPVPGTVVKEVTKDMEGMLIKGVAKDTDVAVITILNVPDEPGMSFKIFGLLAQKNINVDIILQSTGRDGKKDISFTCAEGEADLTDSHLNPLGIVHGGVYCTLLDQVAGAAACTRGSRGLTVNCETRFLGIAQGDVLCGHAQAIHMGRTLVVMHAWVTDSQDTLCADGTYTFRMKPGFPED